MPAKDAAALCGESHVLEAVFIAKPFVVSACANRADPGVVDANHAVIDACFLFSSCPVLRFPFR